MIELIINIIWAVITVFGIVAVCGIIAPMLFAYFMAKELDK